MLSYMRDNKVVPPQLLPGYKTPEAAQALLMQCLKDTRYRFRTRSPSTRTGRCRQLSSTAAQAHQEGPTQFHPSEGKKYVTDEMCKDEGIGMARLPPCEFNPIELVWATTKAGV